MKQTSVELGVGVFVLLGILCVGYLTVRLGEVEVLGDKYYTLNARFTSVTGLKVGAQVEIAGVQVGQVDSVVDPPPVLPPSDVPVLPTVMLMLTSSSPQPAMSRTQMTRKKRTADPYLAKVT